MTEQGETIAARYGRPEIAHRDLEQMIHAVILGSLPRGDEASADETRARHATLQLAAKAALGGYRKLLADPDRLVAYAMSATPLREIMEVPIASRPASRRATNTVEDLRAIPWVFSWNQSRHGIPGWFGLGSALDAVAEAEGEARAQELYARWPFFRALIDNAQLALARADIDVAEQYARLAPEPARALFETFAAEHRRTIPRVLDAAGAPTLLAAWPTIADTVARRNPYVDVLNHAQIELLRRLGASSGDDAAKRIREVLFVTIAGIAYGLQTAG
jgi:phosphoenolpyruvate carboxylase